MKAITLWQPWASLIAVGAKTIETRSWSTRYRGRLLIHAARSTHASYVTDEIARAFGLPSKLAADRSWWASLPLGAIVASCTLADVVPMVQFLSQGPGHEPDPPWEPYDGSGRPPMPCLGINSDRSRFTIYGLGEPGELRDVTSQAPFGDFAPGRYAWLLEDMKPTTERCPRCWGGEIRCTGYHGTDSEPAPCWGRIECGTCGDTHGCDPVPARGHQGLWDWNPEQQAA